MQNLPLRPLSIFTLICFFFSNTITPVLAQVAYSYDQNGNMTSDGTNCYTYNDANQLSQVTNCATNQVIAQYLYDYQGNRIEKKIYSNGTLQRTVYSPNDGYETVKQASNGAITNTTYYQVNNQNVAKKNPDGSKNYFLTDNLGSTNVVTDQTGAVIETTKYYPYGQIRSGGTQSKYLYTGQENDSETNLDYYNSRYYSPQLQRFIQPDSVLPNVYDPQQLNRYAYARNNPLRYTDPSGHNLVLVSLIGILLAAVLFMPAILPHNTHTNPAVTHAVATGINNATQNIQKATSQTKAVATSVAKTVQSTVSNIQGSNKQNNQNSGGNNGSNNSEVNFRSQARLEGHFADHGVRLGYDTPEDYLNGARKLFKGGDGAEALVRNNGDELYYRPATNEFGIIDKTGVIRTYFSPKDPGIEYWNDQIVKYVK